MSDRETLFREPISSSPLTIETERGRLAIIAFYDLDGTSMDETLPESERISSIYPARSTLHQLGKRNILSGPITARSFGEAIAYQNALETSGITICEDGAVICLPKNTNTQSMNQDDYRIMQHGGRDVVVLSKIDLMTLKRFIEEAQKKAGEKIYSSLTTPVEELMGIAGHHSEEFAKYSVDRVASAYIAGVSDKVRSTVTELAADWHIRAIGGAINLNSEDANKGDALQFVADHPEVFFPSQNIQGIIPIIFGNRHNDLEVFKVAEKLGGVGVLVAHPDPKVGFWVDEKDIPNNVIKTPNEAYGFGMYRSLPQVFNALNEKYPQLKSKLE